MIRGINRQLIAEDEEDKQKLKEILSQCKKVCGYELYVEFILGMITKEQLIELHKMEPQVDVLDIRQGNFRMTDEEAIEKYKKFAV